MSTQFIEMPEEQNSIHVLDIPVHEARDALQDMIMFSGILRDLGAENVFNNPRSVLDMLRTFELIKRSTFYEEDVIHSENELVYRFLKIYCENPSIDVARLVFHGRKFNWITDSNNPPLKLTNTGNRMTTALFRLINDSLFYHKTPVGLKDIFQAKREMELAKVYEDRGIGKNDIVAIVFHNIENALNDIEYQGEKYIEDGRVFERYEVVETLMNEMEEEVRGRLNMVKGVADRKLERQHQKSSTLFYRIVQSMSVLLSGNAVTSQLRLTRKIANINRDMFMDYLVNAYSGNLKGLVARPSEIFKNIEDGIYSDEDMNDIGMWVPFTMPFFISQIDIEKGVEQLGDWITTWEPVKEDDVFIGDIDFKPAERVSQEELSKIIGRSSSITEELNTDTRPLVEAIKDTPGSSVSNVINQVSSSWGDVVRNLFALGFLITEKEVKTVIHPDTDQNERKKKYRWAINYPDERVRYIKGTNKLGNHLKKREE
jgi:hypothetical protein